MNTTEVEAAQEQLEKWYSQFGPVVPPLGAGEATAWRGVLQPFPDETEFANVLHHFVADEDVRVEEHGRLADPSWCKSQHSFPVFFSTILRTSFEVVLVRWADSRHPRVYAVSPEISRRRYPSHPHLRDDQLMIIDGKPLSALCTYLSSENKRIKDDMELVRVLDYTSMFLAKHLVYSATNVIETLDRKTNRVIRQPNAGVLRSVSTAGNYDGIHPNFSAYYRTDIGPELPNPLTREVWLWPGKQAPHSPWELITQFAPEDECPCGSGKQFRDCHLNTYRALCGLAPVALPAAAASIIG
jgi:hypothetical protein